MTTSIEKISEIDLARLETLAHTEGMWFESDYWQLRRNLPALLQQRSALLEAAERAERFLDYNDLTDANEDTEEWQVWLALRVAIAAAKGERS